MSDALFAKLSELGIETTTVNHPPVHTVEQAVAHWADIPGGHAKNLFLKDAKKALFMVVARHDLTIDLKAIPERIGSKRVSFGKPELLMEVLGVEPGSVTPFAALNDTEGRVTVVLDRGLMDFDVVNFHPMVNTATTSIAPEALVRFLRATGHDPVIAAL